MAKGANRPFTGFDHGITRAVQLILVVAVVVCFMFRPVLDRLVEKLYGWMYQQWWFRHDSCEPVAATSAFAVWVWMWALTDRFNPFMQRYLINPKGRTLRAHSQGIAGQAGLAYLVILLFFDFIYPRRSLPSIAPSFFKLVAETIASVCLYDFLFFWVHLFMHNGPTWVRVQHTRHHRGKCLVSTEVLRHSFVDGLFQVLVNIVALNAVRAHPLSRICHNIVVTELLTESHAGYDAPWMLQHVLPWGIYGGSVCHEEHHRTGNGHLQQFFTYLDNAHGWITGPPKKRVD